MAFKVYIYSSDSFKRFRIRKESFDGTYLKRRCSSARLTVTCTLWALIESYTLCMYKKTNRVQLRYRVFISVNLVHYFLKKTMTEFWQDTSRLRQTMILGYTRLKNINNSKESFFVYEKGFKRKRVVTIVINYATICFVTTYFRKRISRWFYLKRKEKTMWLAK